MRAYGFLLAVFVLFLFGVSSSVVLQWHGPTPLIPAPHPQPHFGFLRHMPDPGNPWAQSVSGHQGATR